MRKLYTIVLVAVISLVIVLGVLAVAAFGVYQTYLKPEPAEFEFANDVSDISTVEVVQVNKIDDDNLEVVPVTPISDIDGFLAEFRALECTQGMSVQALANFSRLDSFEAIKITYADESFEVITPYGNIDSTVFTPDLTMDTLLNEDFFFFDAEEFGNLLNKYSSK